MKNLIHYFKLFLIFNLFLFSNYSWSKEIIINGNEYSDEEAILSIIESIPEGDEELKANFILKTLNKSGLFKSVNVSYDLDSFYINVVEYPSLNNIFYDGNERLKNDQLDQIYLDLNINTLSDYNIGSFKDELLNIYKSFGFNNIQIDTRIENLSNNTANLYLQFEEGKITKINKINFYGNDSFENDLLSSKIKSKTKKITNIFANNNYKLFQINNDINRINKFYLSKGFKDIKTNYEIEYYDNNRVDVSFIIDEGKQYYISSIKINNQLNVSDDIKLKIQEYIDNLNSIENKIYNFKILEEIEFDISNLLESFGEQFYEISPLQKNDNNNIDILFELKSTNPIYINQINISGNERTFDYVIRQEIDLAEGDSINETSLKKIKSKLSQLNIFKNINVEKSYVSDDKQDINIEVEETQTGTFDVGFSVGTLDGVNFLTGLKEKNINGTGRSLEFLVNTSDKNKAFTFSTSKKFFLDSDVNHSYALNYKENDYSKSKSYQLNTFDIDTSLSYLFSENLSHTFGLGYQLKDYKITDLSTVSDNISKSSGESISFLIKNDFLYNTLNSYIKPTKGNYLLISNLVQTPSSSKNGYIKNLITYKKYLEKNDNIYSMQTRLGNMYSLNNSEILSDDKFSLGGRWLRGFDSFGAGPRDSRTSYVGGNNLVALKLDYSKSLSLNDTNPIYLNLFNDYGYLWGNKNTVNFSDNSIRSSYGFGIKYYSPIGPIGFTWGFPISDKDYDIKRMFTFTVGNLN